MNLPKWWRRWRRRRDYKALSPKDKELIEFLGFDPKSLERDDSKRREHLRKQKRKR